jgi:translocator protein
MLSWSGMNIFYWFTNQFSIEGRIEYAVWYSMLEKPFFAPPAITFGIAWGIIYPLIALAFFWTIYLYYKKHLVSRGFLWLFILNIGLNLTFTATALGFKNNAFSALHILLILGTLAWLQLRAWRVSKVVFWLLTPYLLWGAFATILQLAITVMN